LDGWISQEVDNRFFYFLKKTKTHFSHASKKNINMNNKKIKLSKDSFKLSSKNRTLSQIWPNAYVFGKQKSMFGNEVKVRPNKKRKITDDENSLPTRSSTTTLTMENHKDNVIQNEEQRKKLENDKPKQQEEVQKTSTDAEESLDLNDDSNSKKTTSFPPLSSVEEKEKLAMEFAELKSTELEEKMRNILQHFIEDSLFSELRGKPLKELCTNYDILEFYRPLNEFLHSKVSSMKTLSELEETIVSEFGSKPDSEESSAVKQKEQQQPPPPNVTPSSSATMIIHHEEDKKSPVQEKQPKKSNSVSVSNVMKNYKNFSRKDDKNSFDTTYSSLQNELMTFFGVDMEDVDVPKTMDDLAERLEENNPLAKLIEMEKMRDNYYRREVIDIMRIRPKIQQQQQSPDEKRSDDGKVSVEDVLRNWEVPELEECGKSYCMDYLRKSLGEQYGERACKMDQYCLAKLIILVFPETVANFKEMNNPEGFVCREFLLPSQERRFLEERTLPSQRQYCLLCNRFYTTLHFWKYIQRDENPGILLQNHYNTIGGPDGYDIRNCINPTTVMGDFKGIVKPILKFTANDYVYGTCSVKKGTEQTSCRCIFEQTTLPNTRYEDEIDSVLKQQYANDSKMTAST